MTFGSDFVFCRVGDHQELAKTFANWQSVISNPNLSRKFASTLTVTPVGVVISGRIPFLDVVHAILIPCTYSGTYFGSRAEYDALNIEAQLGPGSSVKVDVKDWLGSVINWAEGDVLQIVGGVVSLKLRKWHPLRSYSA